MAVKKKFIAIQVWYMCKEHQESSEVTCHNCYLRAEEYKRRVEAAKNEAKAALKGRQGGGAG